MRKVSISAREQIKCHKRLSSFTLLFSLNRFTYSVINPRLLLFIYILGEHQWLDTKTALAFFALVRTYMGVPQMHRSLV